MAKDKNFSPSESSRIAQIKFIVFFFFLVLGFTLLVRVSFIDENLILPYTKLIAWISAKSLLLFGIQVDAVDTYMRHPSFSVDIRRGCDGIVATLILVSACIAFPSSWIQKVKGILGGYTLIFVLNLVRVDVLFALGMWGWMSLFEFVHTYIAQFIVIVCAMAFWIFWVSRLRESRDASS
jgi:exosortase H (IPTLxxWG-CTERM-specific)